MTEPTPAAGRLVWTYSGTCPKCHHDIEVELPALPVEARQQDASALREWTWLADSYEEGTAFITDDPADSQRPIADGLPQSVARAIVNAHNVALVALPPSAPPGLDEAMLRAFLNGDVGPLTAEDALIAAAEFALARLEQDRP